MTPESKQLSDLIRVGIANYVKDLHTALPGIIDGFNAADQTASVRPAIKRMFKTDDGETELLVPTELPLLIKVPVVFPSGNGWHLTFPVVKGDECLLIFCERSITDWHTKGGVQAPTAKRFHHLNDAVAMVGLHSRSNKISNYSTTAIELRTGGSKLSIENSVTTVTGDLVITGNTVIQGTTVAQSVFTTGQLGNNGVSVGSDHIHNQPPDGRGDGQASTLPPGI